MALLDFLRQWSTLLVFGINGVLAVAAWMIHRSLVTKEDLEALVGRLAALEQRVVSLEHTRDHGPTKEELIGLRLEMERMRGDMRTHAAKLRAAREQSAAEIETARQLLERSERGLQMIQEYLLNHGK